jgi:putative DNA primase/helicase
MSAPLDGPLYSIRRDLLASSALTPASSAPLRLNGTASAGRSAERKSGTDESAEILQQSRTSDQDQAYRALYGDGGFSSHERMLKQAAVENRQNVLSASCVELFRLAERAGISHVAVADWATLQGQIFSIADDDQLQQVIVEAKEQTQHNTQDPCEPATESKNLHEPELVMQCMADIQPEKIKWLWPGRIAIGKQTLIGGEPGLGKSQITAALAATVTTGGPWPCDEGRAPRGSVLILSAEDDAIRPRLDAAGADVAAVHLISAVRQGDGKGRRTFNLQEDLALLEAAIKRIGNVRLVIIDPVSSYLGKTDSHKNADVRGTLEPLGEMASRLRVAVVSVTHFSKGAGQSAINSFIGSIAFVAAARAAFIVTRDPDGDDPARRLFVQAKNNLAVDAGGLAFRVEQRLVDKDIVASAITWDNERIARTADEILSANREGGEKPERIEAEEFLRDALSGGPRPSTEIEAEAKGAGISWRTVRRAQKALGIKPYRKAEMGDGLGKSGRWYCSLPTSDEAPKVAISAYVGHVSDVDNLGISGHLSGQGGDQ